MKLSTLVLGLISTGFIGGAALADAGANTEPEAPMAAAEELAFAEEGAPDFDEAMPAETDPVADESLSAADNAALEEIAPEAVVETEAGDAEAMALGDAAEEIPVAAEEMPVAEAPAAPDAEFSWEDFEDPSFDPNVSAEPVAAASATPTAKLSAKAAAIPLGPLGVDDAGVEGRIHTVSSGETLWDISEAYLGTPWVWPSVWHENEGIDNPHVIEPGDRLWITSNEMRRISDEEADEMVANIGDEADGMEMASSDDSFDLMPEDDLDAYDDELADEPLPASVEDESELPVAISLEPQDTMTGEVIVLSRSLDANFATNDLMDEASEIMDSPSLRAFLTQGDRVYLGFGEGEVQVGDQYEIFRDVVKIRDIETRAVLGYHYDERGWIEIVEVLGESSVGIIRGAYGEIQRGDKIVLRDEPVREVAVRKALDDIEGSIVFTPGIRWMRGQTDSVYLNVGAIHGVELGTHMQVVDYGKVRGTSKMPDTVIAELVVVGVEAESSVAFITGTDRELEIGDQVRGVMADDQFAAK